ncbi:MAG: hypothetical protein [Circular genetic element sp.]|nr:MAG: hypothetical protein [Circular genetic element sp.]
MKAWHITWDKSEDNSTEHTDHLLVNTTGIVNVNLPYLFIHEVGVTGKLHYHGYFSSQYSKNTIKKKLQEVLKKNVYFSNPDNPKYLKYDRDGVKGVEIYLLKGVTNHMRSTDDLKVIPFVIWQNIPYYGSTINEGRMEHIRNVYEKVITSMKSYKSEVSKISKEKKMTEWQLVLKDIHDLCLDSAWCVKDYLAYTHYTRPEYNFSENGFKNLYRRILKEKDINHYKDYIRNIMDVMTQ